MKWQRRRKVVWGIELGKKLRKSAALGKRALGWVGKKAREFGKGGNGNIKSHEADTGE